MVSGILATAPVARSQGPSESCRYRTWTSCADQRRQLAADTMAARQDNQNTSRQRRRCTRRNSENSNVGSRSQTSCQDRSPARSGRAGKVTRSSLQYPVEHAKDARCLRGKLAGECGSNPLPFCVRSTGSFSLPDVDESGVLAPLLLHPQTAFVTSTHRPLEPRSHMACPC